ncbi:MAG: ABC transporter ATP-binding protein [Oscillospiraceae bacterium]
MLKKNWNMIKKILKTAWKIEPTATITLIISTMTGSLISIITILLSAYVLDSLDIGITATEILKTVWIGVIGIFILTLISSYSDRTSEAHISISYINFGNLIQNKTMTMDYQLLDNPEVKKINRKVSMDRCWGAGFMSVFWDMKNTLQLFLTTFMSAIILVPLFSLQTIQKAPEFLVILIVHLVIIIVLSVLNSTILKNKFMEYLFKVQNQKLTLASYSNNMSYKNGMDIRLYNANSIFENAIAKWKIKQDEFLIKMVKNMSIQGANTGFIIGLSKGVAYLSVVIASLAGGISIGNIVKYAGALFLFAESLTKLIDSVFEFLQTAKRQESTFEYINYPNEMYKGTLPVEKRSLCDNGDNDYEIEFRDVSFKYPGNDLYSLKNVSFKFKVGQKLAVVGMNGSGKTTMIKLLCRLYDPVDGAILLNGIDIRKYDYNEYMSIFGIVFQDFKLLSFELGQNVACSPEYDEEKVIDSLKKAGFGARLDKMPNGVKTCLYNDYDENGVEISGGEAQKIALARALYKDAPFIILDEPTAALDPIAEHDIYSRFNEIVGNKTAVYISHRLSSCIFCDKIAVFDNGSLIQEGSHQQLIKDENSKYYELWNAQAQYYTDEEISKLLSV